MYATMICCRPLRTGRRGKAYERCRRVSRVVGVRGIDTSRLIVPKVDSFGLFQKCLNIVCDKQRGRTKKRTLGRRLDVLLFVFALKVHEAVAVVGYRSRSLFPPHFLLRNHTWRWIISRQNKKRASQGDQYPISRLC